MGKISKEMNIMEIIAMDQGCATVFMEAGMGCLGCAAAKYENLAQACAVHGIDPDDLEAKLNKYFDAKEAK